MATHSTSNEDQTVLPDLAQLTETEIILNALRHPVLLINDDGIAAYANASAEAFFDASAAKLKSSNFSKYLPFGSPLLALIEYARDRGTTINEYGCRSEHTAYRREPPGRHSGGSCSRTAWRHTCHATGAIYGAKN